ncbi:unnamed protein product [Alopecurus aequalis]
MGGLAGLVDHESDDSVKNTDHGVDVGNQEPFADHRRAYPAVESVQLHDPELEQPLDGGGGEACWQRHGDGGGCVAPDEQQRLEHGMAAAPAALGRCDDGGEVAHGGGVSERDGVDDDADGREREHGPAVGAQAQRLGGIERREQRGEDRRVGEQERGEVGELRPRHRRVARERLVVALLLCRGCLHGAHGAGLGEEQEGEGEWQGGEEGEYGLREPVVEEEEELRRRREPRGDEDAAESAGERREEGGVREQCRCRRRAREERGGGEREREERRRGGRRVVVREEGVERHPHDPGGAPHLLC